MTDVRTSLLAEINSGSKALQDYFHTHAAMQAADLVIENLQLREDCAVLSMRLEETEAEVRRLREALEEIASSQVMFSGHLRDLAREALK